MSKYYRAHKRKTPEGVDIYRSLDVTDPKSYGVFIDECREIGYDKALSAFPKKWEWYPDEDVDFREQLIADMPPTASGFIVSKRAFDVLREVWPEEAQAHAMLEVDGYTFFWIDSIFVKPEELRKEGFNRDFFVYTMRYRKCFSQRFVDLWTKHGFTGCNFVDADAELGIIDV